MKNELNVFARTTIERYKQMSVDCVAEVVWVTTVRYISRDCERVLVQSPVKGVVRV